MRPSHAHTHIRSTLKLLKGWHLLFVATLAFGDLLLAGPRVKRLRLVADEHQPGKEKSKMKFKYWSLLASVGFAALLYGASPALAQSSLGTAQSFAVLGGSAVTNTGPTVITGDLGVSPGGAPSGFPPGLVVGGTIHAADAVAAQAQSDVTTAYNALAGMACNTNLTGQDLGGLTLNPGVYCFNSSAQLTGTLTLDAGGNPNAVFIFQIGSALTTASASRVLVINAGQNCNVFWQVGSSATLGTTTAFVGNILALVSITLNTGANLSGRALARTGAVTMDTNNITVQNCSVVPPGAAFPPTLSKAFSPATRNTGQVSTLTITLSNPNPTAATLNMALTDTLPMGLVIAATPNASTTCGGMVTATAGGNTVTLSAGSVIPMGTPGTCTLTVDVTAAAGGNYINTLPANALQTTNGNNAAPAVATLTVFAAGTVQLSKAFSPATINANGVSTLTITLINSTGNPANLTADLIDTLPSGVVIAGAPMASTTCGGTVTATAGGSTVILSAAGSTIPTGAPGTCTVTVNVTAALGGSYLNTLPANALQTNQGNNADVAIATLTVVPPPLPTPLPPVSDDKAGSVLFFNLYTSNPTDLNRQNTRISLTNTGAQSVAVHLFFIDGTTCAPSDAFVCLTPNQTVSFLASDFDPGTTGYIIAVASDPNTGCPINYNFLIGDAHAKLSSGHMANLSAEAFSAIAGNPSVCGLNSTTATLNFNGVSYNQVPRVLAVSNFPSRADGNDTLLILNRFGGDLQTGAGIIGTTPGANSITGVLYDEAERPASFSFSFESCQFRGSITNNFPRTVPRLDTLVPAGRSGWLRLWSVRDVGLLGSVINFNPGAQGFNQGRNLHKLTLTNASLTIPIFPPAC